METEQSFMRFQEFPDKEILEKCVKETTELLDVNPEIKIFGKICHQRRCVGFFSNDSVGYRYSNQLSRSKPMTESLQKMLEIVNTIYGTNFNGILINKYQNGNDYISAHSDSEENCDANGVVAISYGATRKFRIRDKKTKKIVNDFYLEHGSMLIMGGNFQQEFTHEIPIEKKIKEERISFTFRKHSE